MPLRIIKSDIETKGLENSFLRFCDFAIVLRKEESTQLFDPSETGRAEK